MSTLYRVSKWVNASSSVRTLHSALRGSSAADGLPATATTAAANNTLRQRLENDVQANSHRLLEEALGNKAAAWDSVHDSSSKSLRLNTLSLATRLSKTAQCVLDADTPRYLESAFAPSTQCRLVAESRPPYTVVWASTAFQAMSGKSIVELTGKPVLEVLQDLGSSSSTNNSSLVSSLRLKQRDCGVFAFQGGKKVGRMVMSPLLQGKNGSTSHMLFVIKDVA